MGQKLLAYYRKAANIGGVKTRMEFVSKLGITSQKAAQMPDTPQNIKIMEDALVALQKRYADKGPETQS